MIPGGLALAGALGAALTWVDYLAKIPRERVPVRPTRHRTAFALNVGLATAALAWAVVSNALGPVAVLGWALAAGMAVGFEYLMTQAPLPDGQLVVSVGDPLPDFEARDSTGALRRISEWRGKKLLLKFFRGHW